MASRKAKPETAHERATRLRRERYAAQKADKLAAQAAAMEAEGSADLEAIAPKKKHGAAGGSASPTAIGKARDSLTAAFDLMGGVPALVRWGRKNPTEFYRIWARLIPKEAVEPTNEMPLEKLLAMLASKSEKTVAEAAYEIGTETLLAARENVSIEDAAEALRQSEGATRQ